KRVNIEQNSSLSNLQGLENTTSIAEDFLLHSNNALVDLTGLDNITTIGGKLSIDNNNALTSLVGLNNLDSVADLYINNNPSLSTCDIGSICNYLSNPNGSVNIYNNASGCNNPSEIANLCGFTMPCLPHGNYYFFSQADIDDFQTNYTNCTAIEGNITINGSDITSLEGLSTVSSIGGYLVIYQNDALENLTGLDSVNYIGEALAIYWNDSLNTLAALSKLTAIGGSLQFGGNNLMSLSGLDNLTEIGGSLIISGTKLTNLSALSNVTALERGIDLDNNDALINLSGLNNITSIGGELSICNNDNLINLSGLENVTSIEGNLLIGVMPYGGNQSLTNLSGLDNVINVGGDLLIYNNNSLVSLTALSNLTSLGGHLEIFDNLNIASLAGIENIDSESISDLFIFDNSSLSYCEVQSVCDYLSSPNGIIYIYNNAAGCDTQTEVESACSVVGLSTHKEPEIKIYPNPANKNLYISNIFGLTIKDLTIYNLLGQEILHETTIPNEIDLSNLEHGIYVVEIELENSRIKRKLIIEK
ncbi:MAG: T9SS type A sorting domain-containing protein, partial [Bacteroidales bacterium]